LPRNQSEGTPWIAAQAGLQPSRTTMHRTGCSAQRISPWRPARGPSERTKPSVPGCTSIRLASEGRSYGRMPHHHTRRLRVSHGCVFVFPRSVCAGAFCGNSIVGSLDRRPLPPCLSRPTDSNHHRKQRTKPIERRFFLSSSALAC